MNTKIQIVPSSSTAYSCYLIFIAGIGGLLYGIDVGIISAALLYLGKTIDLTVSQTSIIVAAVLGGGMISSLVAGILADWLGRKTMMLVSGLLFVSSVGIIVLSQGFVALFLGRLLQGLSCGVIAVVIPLYLAECLSAEKRGSGSAIFQLLLTIGIAIAAVTGWFYSTHAERAVTAAAGNPLLIRAAQDHAWRGMFLSVIYPGALFVLGCLFLSESPRWLFRKGRAAESLAALRRSSTEDEAQKQLHEMQELAQESQEKSGKTHYSLLRRKYVVPFLLACIILTCNQTTGINSILGYLVIILKQAGMSAFHATQGDVLVKALNCIFTVVAISLVDTKGRRFLLVLGTAGIFIALSTSAFFFHQVEAQQSDVKAILQSRMQENSLHLPISDLSSESTADKNMALTVLYSYGAGEKIENVRSQEGTGILDIQAQAGNASSPLIIKSASYGPAPTERMGWTIAACLALFIAAFAVGPGVVVWLALSELMPTRIRSAGMGIALLLNQGASTLIAGVFLPIVGAHGYSTMFAFWAACTVVYFLTAAFFLPETKGKTLEEIELLFEGRNVASS